MYFIKSKSQSDALCHKLILAAALKELMQQKPFEKITIQDITQKCGIRRQDFYYHFADVYALLQYMFEEEAICLLKKHEGIQLRQEDLLQLFQYIEANREVCLCALNSIGREHLKRFFEADIHASIKSTVEQIGKEIGAINEHVCQADIDLMTHFYVVALTGLIDSWLRGEIDRSPEELVTFTDRMLQDHIRGAKIRLSTSPITI